MWALCNVRVPISRTALVNNYREGTPMDTFNDTRNMRFGEVLVVKQGGVEVYNTTGLNNCPAALWDSLDLEAIARQLGTMRRARALLRNPRKCRRAGAGAWLIRAGS